MTEKEQLIELLKEDWGALTYGEVDGFHFVDLIEGEDRRWSRTVEVITETPSGEFYRWEYEHGLTEYQEDIGPCEYGDPVLTRVLRRETTETITVVDWVKAE